MTRRAPEIHQTYWCAKTRSRRKRPVRHFVRCKISRKRKPTEAEALFARRA